MRRLLLAPLVIALCGCGGGSVGTVRVPPARTSFPVPPAGSLVLAREHGSDALAVAMRGAVVQVSLVGPGGRGLGGERIRIDGQAASSCGAGCYRSTLSRRPHELVVRIGESVERFTLPARAQRADRLVARTAAAWRRLRTLVDRQHLASSPAAAIDTVWRSKAPNSVAYRIRGGAAGIVIGARRWDRLPGGRWQESSTEAQRSPAPPWLEVRDAHLLESRGAAWHVSFFDPQLRAWFELWIEKRTLRTLRLHMTATAHFMRDTYGPFDRPVKIAPP